MTYYKIIRYLIRNGFPAGKADYVRGMIREMVKHPPETRRCTREGYCPLHNTCHYEY